MTNTDERRVQRARAIQGWQAARRAMDKVQTDRLFRQHARSKSTAVRNTIVTQFVPFATMHAANLWVRLPASVAFFDVLSDANVGLMKAVEGFDRGRGIEFVTYAPRVIVGAILDGLRDRDECPRLIRSRAKRWGHLCDRFYVTMGRPPSAFEENVLAGEQGIDVDQHRAAAGAAGRFVSLDDADELQDHHR